MSFSYMSVEEKHPVNELKTSMSMGGRLRISAVLRTSWTNMFDSWLGSRNDPLYAVYPVQRPDKILSCI